MTIQQMILGAAGGIAPLVPFQLTLDASDNSRLGDTLTVQNNWWGTQTYDTEFVTNIGVQSYQGFYAFTAGKPATLTATVSGASGFGNIRGRSITATFSIAVGDRIVFFAGKPTQPPSGYNNQLGNGAGGGASCLMKYDTSLSSDADYANGFIPLIIAAGGGEAGTNFNGSTNVESYLSAPPLSTTTSNTASQIMAIRNSHYPGDNLAEKEGGAGRDSSGQGGGNGWKGPSRDMSNGLATSSAVGLAYGAMGNVRNASNSAPGGFGGGGFGVAGSNTFGAGAGGYYGGCENNGGNSGGTTGLYRAYSSGQSPTLLNDNRLGALSFVHSSGSSVTDNGLYGSNVGNATPANQNKGRVYLSFTI